MKKSGQAARRASCSRRLERDVKKLGGRFPFREAFGNNAQGKCLDAGQRFIGGAAVAQQAQDLLHDSHFNVQASSAVSAGGEPRR